MSINGFICKTFKIRSITIGDILATLFSIFILIIFLILSGKIFYDSPDSPFPGLFSDLGVTTPDGYVYFITGAMSIGVILLIAMFFIGCIHAAICIDEAGMIPPCPVIPEFITNIVNKISIKIKKVADYEIIACPRAKEK